VATAKTSDRVIPRGRPSSPGQPTSGWGFILVTRSVDRSRMAAKRSSPRLEAPVGLVVETFEEGGDTYALLQWPLEGAVGRAAGLDAGLPVPAAQRDVLDLLLAGMSNAEIALRLGRSIHTVAHQVDTIFRRLGVGSRLELFALVARLSRAQEKP